MMLPQECTPFFHCEAHGRAFFLAPLLHRLQVGGGQQLGDECISRSDPYTALQNSCDISAALRQAQSARGKWGKKEASSLKAQLGNEDKVADRKHSPPV